MSPLAANRKEKRSRGRREEKSPGAWLFQCPLFFLMGADGGDGSCTMFLLDHFVRYGVPSAFDPFNTVQGTLRDHQFGRAFLTIADTKYVQCGIILLVRLAGAGSCALPMSRYSTCMFFSKLPFCHHNLCIIGNARYTSCKIPIAVSCICT